MNQDPGLEYEREIRDYLLGRLAKQRSTRAIEGQPGPLPSPPIRNWWLFEGKRYRGLPLPLRAEWPRVARHARRLRATHNPHWRYLHAPEGDVDWVATAFASATSGAPEYVCRASQLGLSDEERKALEGWQGWVADRWARYLESVGEPDGGSRPPWDPEGNPVEPRRVMRWAHTSRRSRWPLLRNVVAESLRATFEPQVLDQLPLPTDHATLFELLCIVRVLRFFNPEPSNIRWMDATAGQNTISTPILKCEFQHSIPRDQMLETAEFDHGLREAMERHRVSAPQWVDGLFEFNVPRKGLSGILLEAKSGAQGFRAAVFQLKCYRAALRVSHPGPMLVWGVVENEALALDDEARRQLGDAAEPGRSTDLWVFSTASAIPTVLASVLGEK